MINTHDNLKSASKKLKLTKNQEAFHHIESLVLQGTLIKSVMESVNKKVIKSWSAFTNNFPASLFKFVRKAVQQQLPTASNLVRWGRKKDSACPLCQKIQTNKHVLSNCSSTIALKRYTTSHDSVLDILAAWILTSKLPNSSLHVDSASDCFRKVNEIFLSVRPDIVIASPNRIVTLELTICHESNMLKSKAFKDNKYSTLKDDLMPKYQRCPLKQYTIEVSTLGLVSYINEFCKSNLNDKFLPLKIRNEIINSVVAHSYSIYCSRNNVT